MEGKIFRITYEDDRGIARPKWIIYKIKDDYLLWFYNPLHEMKIESVPLRQIMRMEEHEFAKLWLFIEEKGMDSAELEKKILEVTRGEKK